eukprot:g3612.t1
MSEIRTPSHEAGTFGAQTFVMEKEGNVRDFYRLESHSLGEGVSGSVSRATHKLTNQKRAIKSVPKSERTRQLLPMMQRERELMRECDHPHIVKLYETFQDDKSWHFVMELCEGGELFDRISNAGHFTEKQAARLMRQMVSVVHYLHNSGIMHRDIKPENFLLKEPEETTPIDRANLKIIDFGLATKFVPGHDPPRRTKLGTPFYVAPEILLGSYDERCDVWSCGVIMYIMLSGAPPFYGDNDAEVLEVVRKAEYSFPPEEWRTVSDGAKELIGRMLQQRPEKRFTAADVLADEWIAKMAPKANNLSLSGSLSGPLKSFASQNNLKKAAITVIATQITDDSVKELRELFQQLDVDNDGTLTAEEIINGMTKAGLKDALPRDQLEDLIKQIDSDGSGQIDYSEFLAATMDKRHYAQDDAALYAAFRVFDKDGNGSIDQQEIADVLADGDTRSKLSKEVIEAILADGDTNGDGMIDFDEFKAMMRKGNHTGDGLVIKRTK